MDITSDITDPYLGLLNIFNTFYQDDPLLNRQNGIFHN
jgi:hypothetical protein